MRFITQSRSIEQARQMKKIPACGKHEMRKRKAMQSA
jgi:hypothetical protein